MTQYARQTANLTIADIFNPHEKLYSLLYDATLILCGSLFIAICAQIKIWLPFSPVPVTGQTFAVLIIGFLYGWRRGVLCVLLYLAEGLAGLPVFALIPSGIGAIAGPSGGYLISFLAAAAVTGKLAEMGWDRKMTGTIAAMLAGNITIYLFGLLWLYRLTRDFGHTLSIGLYPFIIGDLFKIALAAVLLPATWKLLKPLHATPEKTGK